MTDKDKFPSELAERFQLRLPPGLRDRIKAYAERHGRSMNTEIVRILEREFPEPLSLERRIYQLLDLVGVLTSGADNERIGKLVDEIEETLRRMAAGQVKGVDPQLQESIRWRLEALDERRIEEWNDSGDFDQEESDEAARSGRTSKLVDPYGE
ncbi:Arc family DNA-binding protein [Prosthecomicrobium pneumaticum]|uniref:Arc-like DNA binding domain-containing protein n=1 Tax=Prosthecomicrobium pneumaticum TaxID=81895 RepID=A0A7W9FQV5_9HYPH|nr:Arc family DNA-binding protein [Prosthecomicrobium pneumaticum]MBB5755133.1 hypothetical protein [Prosthecomicrobium pneumaticum]